MKVFLRLLSLLSPFRWWIALAILLGCIMVASNMILLGMAAYVIAAAALGPRLACDLALCGAAGLAQRDFPFAGSAACLAV
jgi:hypothetical protein